jgi:hypothetical protein
VLDWRRARPTSCAQQDLSDKFSKRGAVAAREACWVVEHCDGDCSDENGHAEHKSNYDRAAPVASAATVGPVSVAFLVQRSIPLQTRGRYLVEASDPEPAISIGLDQEMMLPFASARL